MASHDTSKAEGASNEANNRWSKYMEEIYLSSEPSPLGTFDILKVEQKAREKLKDRNDAFMYVFGCAGTRATYNANLAAFDKWRIIPRMLRDATYRNVETTLLGANLPAPLALAPIGVQGIVHADAELASARAAAKLGIPFTMSTASTRSIEDVGTANGNGHRWYQLYWPKTPEVTISILNRAKQAGFTALFITLDTMSLGWRPHDLDISYLPFGQGTGIAIATSDPVFMARYGKKPTHDHIEFPYDPKQIREQFVAGDEKAKERVFLGNEFLKETSSGLYRTWEDIKFLREHWEGPIILKGIQSVEDAEKALDYVDGIVVSNHGGRQVDGAIASLDALDKICRSKRIQTAQNWGKFTVLFDSGVRTGADIIKAIALGAQGILYGRPFIYGLAIAGQAGVEQQIRTLLADFELTLGLSGYKNIAEIYRNREALMKVEKLET